MTELILQALYSGVLQGGSYALIALGLALVFGAMKVINLAHGELVLLSAYIAYSVEAGLGWNPIFAIPVSLVLVCLTSVSVYFVVGRIKKDREINSLILTYGIGVILTNLILLIWKADVRSTGSTWMQEAIVVGPFYSMRSEVLFFVVSLVMMIGLWWWLSRSWYGRAVHESEDATRVVGVNSTLLKGLMLLVSAFMCGVVGAFNAHYINFLEPDYAFSGIWVTLPIVAAIFGGYRTITGPLVGAVVVYLIDQLIFKNIIPSGHQLVLGVLLVAMIVFSPDGLLSLLRRLTRRTHAAA